MRTLTFSLCVALGACGGATHPTADAGAAQRTAAAGMVLTFDGSASTGDITRYAWDFGDGATMDGVMVTHAFTTDGAYTVTLTVHGPGGSSAATVLVTVGAACSATAVIVRETTDPEPGQVVLLGSTGSSGCMGADIATYEWDFGDGNMASGDSSKATVQHTYATMGTYMVKLHVVDANGHDGRATYALGVGVSTLGTPQVVCASMVSAVINKAINLTANGSDPGNMALTYAWTFSEGGTATGSSVMHTYTSNGTFTATVIATTTDSRMSSPCTTTVTVTAPIDYTGNWLISPTAASFNGQCPFNVNFPTASVAVLETMGSPNTLTVSPMGGTYPNGGYPLTGPEDMVGSFLVTANTPTENPGGSCSMTLGTAHSIRFTFTSATTVTGAWTKTYSGCVDASCLSCNCNAGGMTAGAFTGFKM